MPSEAPSSGVRCAWARSDDPAYVAYHDDEWGVPVHEDPRLLEMLTLEGAQAGLSWSTILHKRAGYRAAFAGFDPARVASFDEDAIDRLVADPSIVRHRGKISSTVNNAARVLEIQREFGSFDAFLWGLAGGAPLIDRFDTIDDIPSETPTSATISRELKRRGFGFVGPTTVYAFMQAVGMVNDHVRSCPRWVQLGGR
ncbi:MAG: DNA-3-methyladenine glycosylase I [Actinomycetota bacterium]